VRNTGRCWQVTVPEALGAYITGGPLDSKQYRLVSVQAHWGRSEHSLEGAHLAGELQLVHANRKYSVAAAYVHEDGLAIVSVLLERRAREKSNSELEKICRVLPLIQVTVVDRNTC
jgi:carbonic anhydrase